VLFGGVPQPDAEFAAIPEFGFDHVPEVRVIDDDFVEAGLPESLDVPRDERLSACAQERFRAGVRERTHAFAASRGKDHCTHHGALRYVGVREMASGPNSEGVADGDRFRIELVEQAQ
jgi:hypothetical protein